MTYDAKGQTAKLILREMAMAPESAAPSNRGKISFAVCPFAS